MVRRTRRPHNKVPEVAIDTSVWSLALRRSPRNLSAVEIGITQSLLELIRGGRARLMGIVRQELLSGIRDRPLFEKIRDYVGPFDDPEVQVDDYERAAEMNNYCRSRGVTGSGIDFLICAVANRNSWQVFTTDQDFGRYSTLLGVELYKSN